MQEDRLSSHVPRAPGAKGAARNTVVDERPERPEVRSRIAARGGPGVEYQPRVLVEDVSGQRGEAQAIHEPLGALKTSSELASCERGGHGFGERDRKRADFRSEQPSASGLLAMRFSSASG